MGCEEMLVLQEHPGMFAPSIAIVILPGATTSAMCASD
jgi:hypothetical protein